MSFCDKCGKFLIWSDIHVCPPVYFVHYGDCHGESEEGDRVRATAPEYAAERWAEDHNEANDHFLTDGDPITVRVTDPDGEVTHWTVTAEASVSYSSEEAEGGEG